MVLAFAGDSTMTKFFCIFLTDIFVFGVQKYE